MSAEDLHELTSVQAADVYKAGRLAARLRRTDTGIAFTYDDGYLEEGGPAVATTLPVGDEPVVTVAGAVPPFFAGLLPEGRRLSGLRRAVKTSADDELSLLLAVGRDVIGDVQVVPSGAPVVEAAPVLSVGGAWSEVHFADLLADAGVVDRVGLPGVQDKVSARMIAVPISRAGERYLLKLDPPEYPHVVADEAYFIGRALRAGLDAARAEVVQDADGRSGLLVRRFDRVPRPDGTTRPLACEDGCQVLGRWPADKYSVRAEQVVAAMADHCSARAVAVRTFYQQLCFGWLTGNGDIHAKNLSILATGEGEWRASPAYDLPSTVPYDDRSAALSMAGRRRGIARRHLLEFAAAIGLRQRAATVVLDGLLDRLGDLDAELAAGALPFDRNTTIDTVKELRFRRRQAQRAS